MRTRHVATTLAAVTAGVTAAVAFTRRADRRPAVLPAAAPAPVLALVPVVERDAVVLPFPRPVPALEVVAEPAAAPARCGDSGGRTKAGAPCGARPTSGGRCHHHRLAG
jgi:hypothetical protein